MNQVVRAPLAGALALVLATVILTSFADVALVGVVSVVIVLLSIGWSRLLELPSPRGSGVIIAVTGLAAVAMSLLSGDRVPFSTLVIIVIATSVFLSFFHEMFRSDRRQLTLSISGTASGALLSALMVTWLQAHATAAAVGPYPVIVLATLTFATSCALLTLALPASGKVRIPIAIAVAVIVTAIIMLVMGASMPLAIAAAVTAGLIASAATSVFFLVERVIGAYDTAQFLALSTSLLPIVGVLEALSVHLALWYFPRDMGVAIIPSALGT